MPAFPKSFISKLDEEVLQAFVDDAIEKQAALQKKIEKKKLDAKNKEEEKVQMAAKMREEQNELRR